MKNHFLTFLFFFLVYNGYSQEIELYAQFNGHYDFLAIGNTMNTGENNVSPCEILTSSSAILTMDNNQNVIAAYLYWAGSGPGDFDVNLNGAPISAQRTFQHTLDSEREFFAAFAEVTPQIISGGNTTYTLSGLDLTDIISPWYCGNGTNFAGWSIIVVYSDPNLPLNQLSIYDGLRGVSIHNNMITISLDNLNVIDNQGAKIGFLAWEGDAGLSVEETLQVNGNIVSNPPLNPADNAFNGTNSFTGSSTLYNMDIDYYDIENNIEIGDTSATITLTSGNGVQSSDFVMINNIVTVLNSQLPDASAQLGSIQNLCNSRTIEVDYTIKNTNSTDVLPAGVPIAFYADGTLVTSAATQNPIPIGGSETGSISIYIPNTIPDEFELLIAVDDDGSGTGTVIEINEDNNGDTRHIHLLSPAIANPLEDMRQCDGNPNDGAAIFDLTLNSPLAIGNQTDVSVSYHLSLSDANAGIDEITAPATYQNASNPQDIYVRLEENSDPSCYVTDRFAIEVIRTPRIDDIGAFIVCDDPSNDGVAVFDLWTFVSGILINPEEVLLSFHLTQTDAINGANAIEEPEAYQNIGNPQNIYIRLESEVLSECFSIASFQLKVQEIEPTVFLGELKKCDIGFDSAYFNLTNLETQIPPNEITGYFRSEFEATYNINPILHPTNYRNRSNPQTIFVRINARNDTECYGLGKIGLSTENCPPYIPEGFSPNGDGINDSFEISGLYDIYPEFELTIFSRNGNIVYQGNNSIPAWNGTANHGLMGEGNPLPTGTYYYILNLHVPEYQAFKSWVYLNR